jgi:8-oxo-dGTP pyrophosphatase MutT (NUDIX family)
MALLGRSLKAEEAEALADALRFDRKTKMQFLAFLEALKSPLPRSRGELLPLLKRLGWEGGEKLAAIPGNEGFAALLAEAKEAGLPFSVSELPLGGGELLALGARPGPGVGRTLETLLSELWAGNLELDRESLLRRAEKLMRCYVDSYGAVVFRQGPKGPETLMILHRKGWGFPKGHLQPGETEEACAKRETEEETGITAAIDARFRRETASKREGDRRKVIFLLGRYVSGEPRPQPGETREVRWFPAASAAEAVYYPGDRAIYEDAWAHYREHR